MAFCGATEPPASGACFMVISLKRLTWLTAILIPARVLQAPLLHLDQVGVLGLVALALLGRELGTQAPVEGSLVVRKEGAEALAARWRSTHTVPSMLRKVMPVRRLAACQWLMHCTGAVKTPSMGRSTGMA